MSLDHMDELEGHIPPNTRYDYEEAVLAAVKFVVYWNPDGLAWNEADWTIPVDIENED